ncbi:tetratricopeptide repeat protein [bacterium]|nr:MAG: tetratricopeptide repeat protein [bacterium]
MIAQLVVFLLGVFLANNPAIHTFYQIEDVSIIPKKVKDDIDKLVIDADHLFSSNPDKSFELSTLALEKSVIMNYKEGEASAYLILSKVKHLQGKYVEELELLMKAQKIEIELNEAQRLVQLWFNLGRALYSSKNIAESKVMYAKAYQALKSMNDSTYIAEYYSQMGSIYLDESVIDSAGVYYQKALSLYTKLNHKSGISTMLNRLGDLHLKQKNYDKALSYYQQNFDLVLTFDNKYNLCESNINMSKVLIEMGNYTRAEQFLNKANDIVDLIDSNEMLKEILYGYYSINLARKNYEKAILYLEKFYDTQLKISEENSKSNLANLQSIYDKESEIYSVKLIQKENDVLAWRFKLILIVLISVIILSIIGFFGYWQLNKKNKLVLEKESELKFSKDREKELSDKMLQQELDYKQKELVTFTLSLTHKNQLIEDIRDAIKEVLRQTESKSRMELTKIIKLIDHSLNINEDWDHFKTAFEQVHQSFFQELSVRFPDLNANDQRLCALISLNLSLKEVGEILGISSDSVKMARYRLRKKMNLNSEDNLNDFLFKLKNDALSSFNASN